MNFKKLEILKRVVPEKIKRLTWPLYSSFLVEVQKKCIKKIYSRFVKPSDLVFDVGANEGDIADVFLELGAEVVAIEPQPELVKKLKKRFRRNKKIHIIQKGLSDKEEEKTFYINSKDRAISTFFEDWKKQEKYKKKMWDKKLKIKTTTLDKLIDEFGVPKFVKIDVEGFEKNVLKGLHKKPKYISFEFVKSFQNLDDTRECMRIIKRISKKAKFNYCSSEFSELALKEWLDSDKIINLLKENPDKNLEGDIYVKLY